MVSNPNTYAILEVDAQRLSVLRCRRSGKGLEVLSHAVLEGPWPDAEAQSEALKAFGTEHKLGQEALYTVLPRHDLTARILHLPSHDAAEVDSMLRLTAEDHVPFPLHELVIDDCLLERLPDGHSRVLAVFAQRAVVDHHVKMLAAANLEPDEIFVSTACLASAVLASGELHERWAFVHLSRTGLEVLVFHGRVLAFSRGIAASQNWREADATEVIEELGLEIRASLSAYRRESEEGLPVEQVFLGSDWLDMDDVAATLMHELGVECAALDLRRALRAKGLPVQPDEGPGLASLGGALTAQGRGAVRISLVPESLQHQRRTGRLKRQAIAAGISVATVLIALVLLFAQMHFQRQAYIDALSAQVERVRPQAQVLIEKQRQLLILQRQLDRGGSALEYLATAIQLAPEGLNILGFTYREGEGVRISGRGRTRAVIDMYSDALRSAGSSVLPPLSTARIDTTRSQMENDQSVMYYEIVITFPDADEEGPVI